jgi:CheY-like chemotaxis protein
MDGFEVIHRLKADLRRRPIPIIVLTAKELTASDVNSINGSIEKIVRKGGTQAEDLIRELRQTLAALGVADAS